MDPTLIVNIGLMLITGIGVAFTALQANEARRARDDARAARDEAKDYERRAVTASEVSAGAAQRSASALEKAVELQIAQIPTDQWTLTKRDKNHYELTNATREVLFAVDVLDLGGQNDITPFEEGPYDQIGPGESIFFVYERSMASPAQTTLQVTWGDPRTGERFEWRRTLS